MYIPSAEAFKLASFYPELREKVEQGIPPGMLLTLYAALNASKGPHKKNMLTNNKHYYTVLHLRYTIEQGAQRARNTIAVKLAQGRDGHASNSFMSAMPG